MADRSRPEVLMGWLKVVMIVMGVMLGLNGIVQIMTGNMQSGLPGLVVGLAAVALGIFMGTKWKTPMSEQEPLSHAQPKHSGIGIASFVISIAAGVLMFVTSVVAGEMVASTPGGPGGMVKESAEFMMVGFAVVGLLIADLVALGLGIGGLFQKERKKIFAILGTVFSSVVIVATVVAVIYGIAIE